MNETKYVFLKASIFYETTTLYNWLEIVRIAIMGNGSTNT